MKSLLLRLAAVLLVARLLCSCGAELAGNGVQLRLEYRDPEHPEFSAAIETAK